MLRHNTPDEDGWYWIEFCGEWSMAYLHAEVDPRVLVIPEEVGADCICAIEKGDAWSCEDRSWFARVTKWVGPLGCPGGDFDSAINEFSVPQHEVAESDGRALVSLAIDYAHCRDERGQGTITVFGLMSPEEAREAMRSVFPLSSETV